MIQRYPHSCARDDLGARRLGVARAWLAGRFSREAVVNAEDVALTVLEPGRLAHARHRRDIVVPVDTGHVIVLEGDTPALQVGHGGVDVVDVPLSDGVAGLPGVLRLVDAEGRT